MCVKEKGRKKGRRKVKEESHRWTSLSMCMEDRPKVREAKDAEN